MGLSEEILYGNFQSPLLQQIIEQYVEVLPEADLPSEAILDTTLLFLRGLFYSLGPEHEYRWEGDLNPRGGQEDAVSTGITITVDYPLDPKILEIRPALVVQLAPRQFAGLHLNQLKHFNTHRYIQTYHDLIQGSIVIHVVSSRAYQTRRLADWIGLAIRLLHQHLSFGNRFHCILPGISWSGVVPATDLVHASDREYVRSSVMFNYTWVWTGRTSIREGEEHPLRGVRMNLISYGRRSLDGLGGASDIVDSVVPVTHVIEEND